MKNFCRFHVDKMSSAHVYLRRPKVCMCTCVRGCSYINLCVCVCVCVCVLQGMAMDDIPEELITDCAQLVKANSIMGVCVCVARIYHYFYIRCLRSPSTVVI